MGSLEMDDAGQEALREEAFYRRVNGYSEGAQDLISTISSSLLEPDVAQQARQDPSGIVGQMKKVGLPPKEINFVLGHFGLPTLPDRTPPPDRIQRKEI